MRGEKAHKSDKMEDRNECNAIPSHNSDPTHDCSALILPSDLTQLVVLPGQGRAGPPHVFNVLLFSNEAARDSGEAWLNSTERQELVSVGVGVLRVRS